MRHKSLAMVLMAGAALAGCRSAGKVSVTEHEGGGDPLAPFVGRRLVLRHFGDRRDAVAKPGETRKGTCDVAVQVTSATAVADGVRFALENQGRVRVGEAPSGKCERLVPEIALTLKGVHAGAPHEWRAFLGTILLTPEEYATAHGQSLAAAAAPGTEPKTFASRSVAADADARTLAKLVTVWPKPVLLVEPAVSVPGGKIRQESEIEFATVVGADGRAYRPRVKTPLNEEHNRLVTSALGQWRFEPAKEGDKPVAALYEGRTVLRVY
jgi:hypothetical protein